MERKIRDYRIIGFRRNNIGRTSNVYMIRECNNCHAIVEFPSNEVSTEIKEYDTYHEYIKCPNCLNKITILESKKI